LSTRRTEAATYDVGLNGQQVKVFRRNEREVGIRSLEIGRLPTGASNQGWLRRERLAFFQARTRELAAGLACRKIS